MHHDDAIDGSSKPGHAPSVSAEHRSRVYLSSREIEILRLISDGGSDVAIGAVLNISSKTVNYHVENVKRKFRVGTRIQAVVRAIRQGDI